jgi:hypothetical protein
VGKRERRAVAAALRVGRRRWRAGGEQLLQPLVSSVSDREWREWDGGETVN